MPNPFSRSLRSLSSESLLARAWGLLLLASFFGAWGAWFFLDRVSIYVSTDAARIEADQAAHPIQALVSGKIVAVRMVLGQEVQEGDRLIDLERSVETNRLREEQSRAAALAPQLEALRAEIKAQQQWLDELIEVTRQSAREAQARLKEAETATQFTSEQAARYEKLRKAGLVSEADLRRASTDFEKARSSSDAARVAVDRLQRENRGKENEQRVNLEALKNQQALLQGQISSQASNIKRLQAEIEKLSIRAPVSGRLGEVATPKIGQVVNAGDNLGSVIPPGQLRVVAEFPPEDSLGRIRPGQKAAMRLAAFPWIQYGTISATVASVASEVRDGKMRVELRVNPNSRTRIPLQHGLSGSLEVEVERISPAALLLRAAGKRLAVQTSNTSSSRNEAKR